MEICLINGLLKSFTFCLPEMEKYSTKNVEILRHSM